MLPLILCDASHLGTPRPTGVENYVDALLPRLATWLQEHGAAVVWVSHQPAPPLVPSGVQWVTIPYRRGWGQWMVPQVADQVGATLYFTPSGSISLKASLPQVMTVHDLSVYDVPRAYTWSQRLRQQWLLPRAAHRAARLFVPSGYVGRRITKQWHVPAAHIAVTPLAVDAPAVVKAVAVPGVEPGVPVILYLGRLERKKNLVPVIQAFGQVAKHQAAQLVLAGTPGFGSKEIAGAIVRLPQSVQSRVQLPGYISPEQKQWLLQQAQVWVVPSPYEGFGLPVLEGFQAKVPVIGTTAGAVPEVAGQAATLVAADSVAEWAEALERALTDTYWRKKAIQAGTERLATFSWERTVRLTGEGLLSVL